jgi:DNA uptake protein ComE-like DNA-binding protein
MNPDPQTPCESCDHSIHWTAQLPWLLALLMIILYGLLKMDVAGSAQSNTAEEKVYEKEVAKTDLNTASQEELEALPHIGPVLARRIIAARPFGTVQDLARVQGLGPALVNRLTPWVTVAR